jgi:hypothetical protein
VWECKDQERWRKEWLAKLARDVGRHKAAFGLIVTSVTSALQPGIGTVRVLRRPARYCQLRQL